MTFVPLTIHTPTEPARRQNDVREIIVAQRLHHDHFRPPKYTASVANPAKRELPRTGRRTTRQTALRKHNPTAINPHR